MEDLDTYFNDDSSVITSKVKHNLKNNKSQRKLEKYNDKINYSDIDKVKVIGKGMFGKVYKCLYKKEVYALKTLTNSSKQNSKERERHLISLKLEARALSQVRVCDYVIQLVGTCVDSHNQICILMEYVHGPNLHQFMLNFHHRIPWSKKEALAWEIATGVAFIHDSNILHRDLKSDNILISLLPNNLVRRENEDINKFMKKEPIMDYVHAKIADFGICKITTEVYSTAESFRGAGSPPWMAPELCLDENLVPSKQSDVYSLGWILWELAVNDGKRPYEGHNMNQIFQFKLSGYVEPLPEGTPEYYRDLVDVCTSYDPKDRPLADQVVATILDSREQQDEVEVQGNFKTVGNIYETKIFMNNTALLNEANDPTENPQQANGEGPFVVSLASEESLRRFTTAVNKEELLEHLATEARKNDIKAKTDLLVLYGVKSDSEQVLLCGLGDCYSSGQQGFTNLPKAIALYEQAASMGHAPAICKLGLCYRDGIGKQQNIAKAIHCFEMAAEQGDPISQCCLGECYILGIGVEQNHVEAIRNFELAANQGNADAQMQIGKCYYNGLVIKTNTVQAYNYFKLAAVQNHPEAQYILGVMYAQGISRPPNRSESYDWFLKAAKLNHPEAQNNVGSCYYFGRGVARDFNVAVDWFYKSALQDNASAQNNLGHCYEMGHGVKVNLEEALKWFGKAAANSHSGAQNSYGNFFMVGNGTEKNPSLAFEWYQKSAENGHPRGQKNLALCYYEGVGTVKDLYKAYHWYSKAAEQGNVESNLKLGRLASKGEGITADSMLAFYWYHRAAEAGDPAGQVAVGKCFLRGKGVPKDLNEGFLYISKAAAQNYITAITYLGVCFLNGHGTPKSPVKAYQCFIKSASSGSAQAQFHLADLYRKGVGVPNGADMQQAYHYYEQAATRHHPLALFYLGVCYHRGLGVKIDLEKSLTCLEESVQLGCKEADAYLDKVKVQLTSNEISGKGMHGNSDPSMSRIQQLNIKSVSSDNLPLNRNKGNLSPNLRSKSQASHDKDCTIL